MTNPAKERRMTSEPTFYVQRNGFRETLMVFLGEDEVTGEPIEREATVEEEALSAIQDAAALFQSGQLEKLTKEQQGAILQEAIKKYPNLGRKLYQNTMGQFLNSA